MATGERISVLEGIGESVQGEPEMRIEGAEKDGDGLAWCNGESDSLAVRQQLEMEFDL